MPFDQRENLRDAILKKRARIAHIDRTLNRPLPTEWRGQPARVSERSLVRLEEEKQHLLTQVAELEREQEHLGQAHRGPSDLPDSLQSAGDPIGDNPFSTDDRRYRVWQQATLNAEQELCRLNSEFLRKSPTGQEGFAAWMQQNKWASAAQDFAGWTLDMCVAKFDIWARRGIQVVWSENAVRAYDQWLFNYAKGWLNVQKDTGYLSDSVLLDLKSRLAERVECWKAEARRYLTEVNVHLATNAEVWTKLERRGDLIVLAEPSNDTRTEMKRDYRSLYRIVRKFNQWVSQKKGNGEQPTLEEAKEAFRGTILIGDTNRVPYLTDGELQNLIAQSQTPSSFAERIISKRWGLTDATGKTYLRRKSPSKRAKD
jgi:hypothetical protein